MTTLTTTTILTVALGLAAAGVLVWAALRQLRWLRFLRLERRYFGRWARLSPAEKVKVLEIMGVVPMVPFGGTAAAPDTGRLDRLFRAVLAESGRDLGLSGFGGLVSSALPLALLDAEIEWALAEGTRVRRRPSQAPG